MNLFLRKKVAFFLAAISIAAVISIGLIFEPAVKIYGYVSLDENRLNNIKNTLTIYDKDQKIINNAQYTPLSELKSHTVDAFLCAEDKRFYTHEGIDYTRILSAAVKDLLDGAYTQGASTITQQLIKNSHLSNDKTIKRKIQEIRLSRQIERKYTKNQILEMYLNILYFGNGTYGIGNAAYNLFDKTANCLSVKQSAMLAAIINNPALYNPYKNIENLNKRTALILKLMLKNGKISEEEYTNAINETTQIKKMSLYDKYRYFVIKEACSVLGCNEEYLFRNNVKINTFCDTALQHKLSFVLSPHTADCLQIVVIENKTAKIIAHEAKYNGDPSTISRSPGSTIKPIICFAPAIEKGIILPITPILDEKISFGSYSPSNYKNEYHGWVSCKYALKESLNLPAVKLLDYVGLDYAKKFASSVGISTQSDEGLALALGGMKYGTTLKNIASAYTAFASGGTLTNTSYIKSIYLGDKLVYSYSTLSTRVMKEETAYFINEMLNECAMNGTAKTINSAPLVWAAKTGTVGNQKENFDAYCIAYSVDYTIGVHIMGNSTVTGGGLPTKLVKKLIMSDIISDKTFNIPSSIRKIDINAIEYNKNQKVITAEKNLPKKDTITASFPIYALPEQADNRSDYEKGLDFFDMNNFTVVDSFFD